MKIREAKDQLAVRRYAAGVYRSFIERECWLRWGVDANWALNLSALPLHAFISNSDWVVACDTCREQCVIDYDEIWFCPNCLNVDFDGMSRKVIFPKDHDRAEIETILLRRPNPNNRNWLPHETVDVLRGENKVHGLEK